jgi:hypothetical protein
MSHPGRKIAPRTPRGRKRPASKQPIQRLSTIKVTGRQQKPQFKKPRSVPPTKSPLRKSPPAEKGKEKEYDPVHEKEDQVHELGHIYTETGEAIGSGRLGNIRHRKTRRGVVHFLEKQSKSESYIRENVKTGFQEGAGMPVDVRVRERQFRVGIQTSLMVDGKANAKMEEELRMAFGPHKGVQITDKQNHAPIPWVELTPSATEFAREYGFLSPRPASMGATMGYCMRLLDKYQVESISKCSDYDHISRMVKDVAKFLSPKSWLFDPSMRPQHRTFVDKNHVGNHMARPFVTWINNRVKAYETSVTRGKASFKETMRIDPLFRVKETLPTISDFHSMIKKEYGYRTHIIEIRRDTPLEESEGSSTNPRRGITENTENAARMDRIVLSYEITHRYFFLIVLDVGNKSLNEALACVEGMMDKTFLKTTKFDEKWIPRRNEVHRKRKEIERKKEEESSKKLDISHYSEDIRWGGVNAKEVAENRMRKGKKERLLMMNTTGVLDMALFHCTCKRFHSM